MPCAIHQAFVVQGAQDLSTSSLLSVWLKAAVLLAGLLQAGSAPRVALATQVQASLGTALGVKRSQVSRRHASST